MFKDGYGDVLKIIGIVKDPWVPRGRLIDSAVHGEGVLYLFWIVEDAGGRASEQEQKGKIGVDHGDDVVVRWRDQDRYLVEGEDWDLEGGADGELCEEIEECDTVFVVS